jgi:hypothetical protein
MRVGEVHVVGEPADPSPGALLRDGRAARVVLQNGRFLVCWTRGTDEAGHRALAQAFDQDGSPRGAPVVISPPGVDVVGPPRAISRDGHRVVATFNAWSGGAFEVREVALEDFVPQADGELSARR